MDELAEMMMADFQRFKATSMFYGLGAAQVRLLFIIESTLISVLGAVAGYLFSLLAAQSLFQGRSVTLLPGIVAVLVTAVVAAVCSRYVVLRDVADVLRNP